MNTDVTHTYRSLSLLKRQALTCAFLTRSRDLHQLRQCCHYDSDQSARCVEQVELDMIGCRARPQGSLQTGAAAGRPAASSVVATPPPITATLAAPPASRRSRRPTASTASSTTSSCSRSRSSRSSCTTSSRRPRARRRASTRSTARSSRSRCRCCEKRYVFEGAERQGTIGTGHWFCVGPEAF